MSQPVITLTYAGIEQSAAAWGLNARPVIKTRDRSPTEISFRMAGSAPEAGVPFNFYPAMLLLGSTPTAAEGSCRVVIRSNRTYNAGAWSGAGWVFTVYLASQPADVGKNGQGITVVFRDVLWLLQRTTFQQQWTIAGAANNWISRCVMFMDINNWSPNLYQSVQWQVNQIISFAANQCGIPIAAGTIDYSGWFLNYFHCRALSCYDALLKCLQPLADAKLWVDGSVFPPQINVRTRANIAGMVSPSTTAPGPITLPYKGIDAAGRTHHSSKSFTPCYDVIPPQVVLQYQINNTYNGKPAPAWTNDVYPANSTGLMPFAMVCPIDLTGAGATVKTGTLDCQPLMCASAQTGYANGTAADHAAKRAWWGSKRGGEHHKLSNPNGTTNWQIRFQDTNYNPTYIGDATVTDESGNAISLAIYPNRHVRGTFHKWMVLADRKTPVVAIRAKITVTVALSEYDVAASTPAETDTNGNRTRVTSTEKITFNATLTNAPAGVTSFVGSEITGNPEGPVPNLAQNIWESRQMLDYDGTHEIIDAGLSKGGTTLRPPIQQIIGHWNLLNLSGAPGIGAAWATANMTIASSEIDLVTNHVKIEVGPSNHLQPQDWSSMLNFFRMRHLTMPSSVRATGLSDASNTVDMPLNTPDANTVHGQEVNIQEAAIATDTTSSNQNVITTDATTNAIFAAQNNASTGANITTGYIRPEYTGAGSPTATTLPANSYYRIQDRYWDSTAKALWYCTTAGSNSTSVWSQVGGGGGSVGQYAFVSDGGDYIVATQNGVAPVVTALSVGFTNGASVTSVTVVTVAGIAVGSVMTGTGVPSAGAVVTAVNTTTKVVSVSFTATAASSGNYTFTAYVNVAKPPKIRCSITSEAYIDGTGTHTFSYTAVVVSSVTVAYTRLNSWAGGSQSQTEKITPAYLPGDIIYAMTMPSLNMPISPGSGTTVAVTLLDIHDKDWAL